MLAGREKLNLDIQQALDAQTNSWGIKSPTSNETGRPDGIHDPAICAAGEAERERRAKVIHAEGELQASEKLYQAAKVLAQEPQAIQLRYLETLNGDRADKNTTVVFPLPMDIISPLLNALPTRGSRRHQVDAGSRRRNLREAEFGRPIAALDVEHAIRLHHPSQQSVT